MRYPYRERQNADPAQNLREIVRFEKFLKKSVSVGNPIKAFVVIHNERSNSSPYAGKNEYSTLWNKLQYLFVT